MDINSILNEFGTCLKSCSNLGFEWSLTLSNKGVSDRNRFTSWINAEENKFENLEKVGELLRLVSAPPEIIEIQSQLASYSYRQGLSVSLSEKNEFRLYIQYAKPGKGRSIYKSYRWADSEKYQTADYEFYFFPETPQLETPSSLVNPLLKPALIELLTIERLHQTAGFWLRKKLHTTDQVDLIFPWQPQLGELQEPLRKISLLLGISVDWLDQYNDYPLRHIAFSTHACEQPKCSLYFSSSAGESWPENIDALKQIVYERGNHERKAIDHFFRSLPVVIARPKSSLDDFYSTANIENWQKILGPEMHYHAGLFNDVSLKGKIDDVVAEKAVQKAVEVLYPFISKNSRVYDIGCGWCGPMQLIVRDLNCKVIGITVSKTQYRYGTDLGMQVRYGDVEQTFPPGVFDCMLLIESFCHVSDKVKLLRIMRACGKRLIMRVNCQDTAPNSINFGGTMHMVASSELKEMIQDAGWRIIHWKDRRLEAIPSVHVWNERIKSIPQTDDFHLETLRKYCSRVMSFPYEWAAHNPLIEVVAD